MHLPGVSPQSPDSTDSAGSRKSSGQAKNNRPQDSEPSLLQKTARSRRGGLGKALLSQSFMEINAFGKT